MANRAPLLTSHTDTVPEEGWPERLGTVVGAVLMIAVTALIAWPLLLHLF